MDGIKRNEKNMNNNIDTRLIKNFFSEELFEKIKQQVLAKNLGPQGPHFYHTVAGRWLEEITFDIETEKEILDIAIEVFGDSTIKRAGFHTGRYQMQQGIKPQLWKHWDQSACQFSLDVCIEKTIDWKLVVEDVEFNEEQNSCVVFSGNDQIHWRTPYPSDNEDDYVHLLFMQFAKPDHWFFVEGSKNGFNNHGHEADFKFRARMGYWSQPDYSDGRPICACCDYRPVLNFEKEFLRQQSQMEKTNNVL